MSQPEATATAATAAPAAKAPAKAPAQMFFFGTAAGVVLTTVISAVGFVLINQKLNQSVNDLADQRDKATEMAQGWEAQYRAQKEWVDGREAAFEKDWQNAKDDPPVLRRLMLLSYRPVPASTMGYKNTFRLRYDTERSAWWEELERNFGPSMPEEIPGPNVAMSESFFNFATWSMLIGDVRDAHDALKVALLWAAPGKDWHIHHAMGHHRYRIPADIENTAPKEKVKLLEPFVGQWVTEDNQAQIEMLEADARAK
ncbi:MAG: hypothetical protein AB7K09_04770 [Planctomycetota bacterium]